MAANLAALRLLLELRADGRPATGEEQAVLARWSGWGAVGQLFDREEFTAERAELHSLLSEGEYAAARRSTINAHYTDAALATAIWDGLGRLGFTEGEVLEPGCGSGHFIGLAPPSARMLGVERDPISAGIAAALYPQAEVITGSFADLDTTDGTFDATVGNVPFAKVTLHDPRHNTGNHSIHNHFIIKALRLTRPGGIVAVLTSRYTLDARNPAARVEIGWLADLVGAVRLPSGAHRRAAGTEAVTDLLILRRREPETAPLVEASTWARSVPLAVGESGATVEVNQYFHDHPEHVLGEFSLTHGMHNSEDLKVVGDLDTVAGRFADTVARITTEAAARGLAMTPRPAEPLPARPARLVSILDPSAAQFAGFLTAREDGTFTRQVGGMDQPYLPPANQAEELRALLGLRDVAMGLVRAEQESLEDTPEIRQRRAELNTVYDGYVATYGPVNRFSERRQLRQGWHVFGEWCDRHDLNKLRAATDTVVGYLDDLRLKGLGRDRLQRHLDAIVNAHEKAHTREAAKAAAEVAKKIARQTDGDADEITQGLIATRSPESLLGMVGKSSLRLGEDTRVAAQAVLADAPEKTSPDLDLDALGLRTTVIDRPPQGGFRDDPFANVVRALEKFDPTTQSARKADIFTHRVVNPPRTRLGADTAEEALSICLDTHSRVDLDEIARLMGLGGPAEARAALGELVYDDPDTGEPIWARQYLSGNVRQKLALARLAAEDDQALAVNVAALERVVPADLGPEDIEIRLGSWIGPQHVQQFLRELLDDPTVRVERVASMWLISNQSKADSVAATQLWGGGTLNAYELTEKLLIGSEIRVTKDLDDESTAFDPAATEEAKDKAREISDRFADWVWDDTTRAQELIEIYNNTFNAEIPPDFSGVELSLPGLSRAFTLRPHQLTAVARIVYQPATGLIHEVGAGKTLEMIVGIMERRRRGLATKPVVVVPNDSIAEQFEREWLQAYPGARLLTGTSADLASDKAKGRDGRAEFVARVATGDWDTVIMTKESFQRIPLHPEAQEEFLSAELADLRSEKTANKDAMTQTMTKRLETAMENAEERLKKRLDEIDRDVRGVTLRDSGIDFICVDEAQNYKNGLVASALPDLGIDGADRSIDLDMKLAWLADTYGSSRVVLATATPWTGKFSEIYLWQRRLGHQLPSFDTWARSYCTSESFMEMTPGGTLRPKTRMRRVINEPELWRSLRLTSDIKMKADLNLPTPKLRGGTIEILTVPAPVEARIYTLDLARRERNLIGPPEKGGDNHLVIQHDGQLCALDVRCVGLRTDAPQKVDVVAEDIHTEWTLARENIYRRDDGSAHPVRGGLILVFCDESTPGRGWNLYTELKQQLVARGMPEEEIRFIHEATSPQRKADLLAACREGAVSVLIGSTMKMGAGLNVQTRAIGGYELTGQWRPDITAQAKGRVERQGNQNPEFFWKRVVLSPSMDAKKWEITAQKHNMFAPLYASTPPARSREVTDDDAVSLADVMAAATGDPRYREKAELDQEHKSLTRQRSAHVRTQQSLKLTVASLAEWIPKREARAARQDAVAAQRIDTRGDAFRMTIGNRVYDKRGEAAEALKTLLVTRLAAAPRTRDGQTIPVGSIGGYTLTATLRPLSDMSILLTFPDATECTSGLALDAQDLPERHGLITRLENQLDVITGAPAATRERIENDRHELAQARSGLDKPFPHEQRLAEVTRRRAELVAELSGEPDIDYDPNEPPDSPQAKARAERAAARQRDRADLLAAAQHTAYQTGLDRDSAIRFADWCLTIAGPVTADQRPPLDAALAVWSDLGAPNGAGQRSKPRHTTRAALDATDTALLDAPAIVGVSAPPSNSTAQPADPTPGTPPEPTEHHRPIPDPPVPTDSRPPDPPDETTTDTVADEAPGEPPDDNTVNHPQETDGRTVAATDPVPADLERELRAVAVRDEMLRELSAASFTHIQQPGIGAAGSWDEATRTVTTDPDLPFPVEMTVLADLVDSVRVQRHRLAEDADTAYQHLATGDPADDHHATLFADATRLDTLARTAAMCTPQQRGYLIPGSIVSTRLHDDQIERALLGFARAAARGVAPSDVLAGTRLLVPSDRITWRAITITFQTTPTGVCATLATADHSLCDTVEIADEWLHDDESGAQIRAVIEHAVTSAGARADVARRSLVDLVEHAGPSEPATAPVPTPAAPDSGTNESSSAERVTRPDRSTPVDTVNGVPGSVAGGSVTDDDHAPGAVVEPRTTNAADDVVDRQSASTSDPGGTTTVGHHVPLIEHNHSGTVVRRTSKEDLELRRMLSDNKFKYSTRQGFWYLGRQQRYGTRSFRVRNLIEALERAGREYELREEETAATAESAPTEVPTAQAFTSPQQVLAAERATWDAFLASRQTPAGREIISDWRDSRPDGRALRLAANEVIHHGLDGEPQAIVDRYVLLFRTASALHANLTAERKRAPQFMTNLAVLVKRSGAFAGRLIATIEAGDAHVLTRTPEPITTAPAPATAEPTRSTSEQQLGFFDLTDQPPTPADHGTDTTAVRELSQAQDLAPDTAESHPAAPAEHRPLQTVGDAAEDQDTDDDQPRSTGDSTKPAAVGADPDAVLPSAEVDHKGHADDDDGATPTEEWERAGLDALYTAEGWTFVDGLTGVSDLFRAHHWDLVDEVPVEVGGIYTEHWRRHDVSIGVSITPDDRVMTTAFLRNGPWESPHWVEVELTTAAAVRELIDQAGLHGVARPARLPGLWRVEGTYRAADAVDAVEAQPEARLATRPADAVEEAWFFATDGTGVWLAPPLPDVPATTRAQVVSYVLGDHAGDKRVRALVSVLLSGRARNGITPDDALTGLADHDLEVYRRAVAATAGRGDRGAAFDVDTAREALERLVEGDPTLPLNCLGEYVELAAPDDDPEQGPAPTGPVRGVVVDVAAHLDRVVVTIARDGRPGGTRLARQSFAVDAVVLRLDPALRASEETAPEPETGVRSATDTGPAAADGGPAIAAEQPDDGVDGLERLAASGSAATHVDGALVQTLRHAFPVGWSTKLVTDTGIVLCLGHDAGPDPAAAIARHRAYVAAAADLQQRYARLVDRASEVRTNMLVGGSPGYQPPEPGTRFTHLHEFSYFLHQTVDRGLVDRLADQTRQPVVALGGAYQRAIDAVLTALTAPDPVPAAGLAARILTTDEQPRNTAVRLAELIDLIDLYWTAAPDAEPDQIAVCHQASGHLRQVVEQLVAATADRASLLSARIAGLLATELDDSALEHAEHALAEGDHLAARERLAWAVSTHDPLSLVDPIARQALRALLFSTDDQLAHLVRDAHAENRAQPAAETITVLAGQLRRLAGADTRLGQVLHGIQITEIADRLTSFAAQLAGTMPSRPDSALRPAAEPAPLEPDHSRPEPTPAVPATVDTPPAGQAPAFANREALIRYVLADQPTDAVLRRLVLVELGGRARDGVYPGGAAQQLAALHPEVYRRTVTAAVGRTRRGVPFDLNRAHAALLRLAEDDPTLPINTVGRYVELSEPDRSHPSFRVENGQPVDTTPRIPVRGRVCQVRAEPTGVSVLIERDVTALDGAPYASQTVPADATITVLDDTEQPSIDELWRRRRAMHPTIAAHTRSLGLHPTPRAPTPAEAVGRPGRPVDVDTARASVEEEITRELEQLPPSDPDDTVPADDGTQVEALLTAAVARERFLTNAAAMISLAADDHYRLDGEVIEPDQIDHLLAVRARAALEPDTIDLSTLTWQGLWIHFRPVTPEPGSAAVVTVVIDALGAHDTDGLSGLALQPGNESQVRTTVENLVSAHRPVRPARQAAVMRQTIAHSQSRLAAEPDPSDAIAGPGPQDSVPPPSAPDIVDSTATTAPRAASTEESTEDADVPHVAVSDQDIAHVLRHLLGTTLSEFVAWMRDPTNHRPPPNDQGFAGSRRSGDPDPGAHESVTVRSGRVEIDVHTNTEIRTGRPTWTTLARWLRPGLDPADLCLLQAVHAAHFAFRIHRHGFTAIGETRLADAALRELMALRRTVTQQIIDRALAAHLAGTAPRRWRGPGPDPLLRAAQPTELAGDHRMAWDRITALRAVLPDRTERRRPLTALAVGDVLLHPGYSGIALRLTAITSAADSFALTVEFLGPRWEPGEHTRTLPMPATNREGNPATIDVVVAPNSLADLVAEDQAPQPLLTPDVSPVDNRDSGRLGFGGRVVQLQQRTLAPAPVSRGWDSVDAIVDHLAAMPCPHPVQASSETQRWEEGRTRLLAAVRAGRSAMAPAGTLLAYRARDDRTKRLNWVVVHAATGHPILTDRGAATAPRHPRPGHPTGRPEFVDLPDALIPAYLDALERLVDSRGHQIDWMLDFPALQQSLRRWQDLDADGTLPEPGSGGRGSGITGLHTAATFHAATGNPLAAARYGAFTDAVVEIAPDRHEQWDHRHAGWVVETFGAVRRAFGRSDEPRHHDPHHEQRAAREDRITVATVRLAQARAVGAQPHQAVRDLEDRAQAIQGDDEHRPDQFSSAQLRSLIPAIAELCSPVPTELDRLLTAQVGDHILIPGPTGTDEVGDTWVITRAAEAVRPDHYTSRVDLLHPDGPVHGTLDIDLTEGAHPIRIHYDYEQPDNPTGADRHDDHLSRVAAGTWALVTTANPAPRTADAVHQLSRRALTAFLAADPSATTGPASAHPTTPLGAASTRDAIEPPAEQHALNDVAGSALGDIAEVSTATSAPPPDGSEGTASAETAPNLPSEITTGEHAARYLWARHKTRDVGWDHLLAVGAEPGFYLQVAATSLAQVRDACRRLWPVARAHGFGLAAVLDPDTLDDAHGAGLIVHLPRSATPDRDIAAVVTGLRGYVTSAAPVAGATPIATAVSRSKTSPAHPTPRRRPAAPQPQPAATEPDGPLTGVGPGATTANHGDDAPAHAAHLFAQIHPDAVQAATHALDERQDRDSALGLIWSGLPIDQSRLDRPALHITGDVITGLVRGAEVDPDLRARQEIATGRGLPTATTVAAIATELDHHRSTDGPLGQVLRRARCDEVIAHLYAIADHMALHGEFTVPGRPEMRHQLALGLFDTPSTGETDPGTTTPADAPQAGSQTRRPRSSSPGTNHLTPTAPMVGGAPRESRSEPTVDEPAHDTPADRSDLATPTHTTGPDTHPAPHAEEDTALAVPARPASDPAAVIEPDAGAGGTTPAPANPFQTEPAPASTGEALHSAATPGPGGIDQSADAGPPPSRDPQTLFEDAITLARTVQAETEAAGGHKPEAWLRLNSLVRTDPHTGIQYAAVDPRWQTVAGWWCDQASAALTELGYTVHVRGRDDGRRGHRANPIEVDAAAREVVVDAALPLGLRPLSLVAQVAALRDIPGPEPAQPSVTPPQPKRASTADSSQGRPDADRPQPDPTGPDTSTGPHQSTPAPSLRANGLAPAVLAMRDRLAAAGIDWPDTLTRFVLAEDAFDAQDHLRALSRTTDHEPVVQTVAAMALRAQRGHATRRQVEHLIDRVLAGDPSLPARAVGRQIRHPRSGQLHTVTAVRADIEGRLLVQCGQPRDPGTVAIALDPDAWANPTAPEVLPAGTAFPLLTRWERLANLVHDHGYTLIEQPGESTVDHDRRRVILGAATLAERLTRLADLVDSLPPSPGPEPAAPAATTPTPRDGTTATETPSGAAEKAGHLAGSDEPGPAATPQPVVAERATIADAARDLNPPTPDNQRELYVRINEEAMRWFYGQLAAAPAAQQYLRDRLGGQDAVDRVRATRAHPEGFLIGYAPAGWTGLVEHLRAQGFRDQDVMDAGVATVSRRGSLIDRFRDRIMFGIRDAEGRLAGFTGRALSDTEEIKYLNTPATPLFDKGSLLFGLHEQHALAERADPIFVEGPFDVLAIAASGATDRPLLPVGVCGTALTHRHLATVDALIPTDRRRVIAFDADAGGRPAMRARATEAVAVYPNLDITALPDGMDPASWARATRENPNAAYHKPPYTRPALEVLADAIVDSWADQLRWAEGRIGAAREVAWLLATVDQERSTPVAFQIADRLGLEAHQMANIVATALHERAHPPNPDANPDHHTTHNPDGRGHPTTRADQPPQPRPAHTGHPDRSTSQTGPGDTIGSTPPNPPTPTRRTRSTGPTHREPPAHDGGAATPPPAQPSVADIAQQWTRLTRQAISAGYQVCTDFDHLSSVDIQTRVIRINGHRDAATRVAELTELLATLATPTPGVPPEHGTEPAQEDSTETPASAPPSEPASQRVASVAAPETPIPEWMDPPLFRTLMSELGWDDQPDLLAGLNSVPVAWIPAPRQPLPKCLTPIYDQLAREFWGERDHRGNDFAQQPTAPTPDPPPRTRTGRTRTANTNTLLWPGGIPVTTTPLGADRTAGAAISSHFVHAGIAATRGRAR